MRGAADTVGLGDALQRGLGMIRSAVDSTVVADATSHAVFLYSLMTDALKVAGGALFTPTNAISTHPGKRVIDDLDLL